MQKCIQIEKRDKLIKSQDKRKFTKIYDDIHRSNVNRKATVGGSIEMAAPFSWIRV